MASRRDRYGSAGLAVSAALLTVRMAGASRSSRASSLSGQDLPAGRLVPARVQERTVAGVGRPNRPANQRRAAMGTPSVELPADLSQMDLSWGLQFNSSGQDYPAAGTSLLYYCA